MNQAVLAAGFFVAFLVAICFTPLVAWVAKYNKWVDLPGGKRTVHKKATPRAGGLAIIIAFICGITYLVLLRDGFGASFNQITSLSVWGLLLGGGVIACTGLYDDAYGLGFKKKFLFQLLVAYTMYLTGYRIEVPAFEFLAADPYLQAAFGLPLTILWYVGVINAVNLIDGLDGLAAGISLISFCSIAALFGLNGNAVLLPVGVVMAGALLGFLIYNFNPASIFLGDTGSLFVGFMIATYALQGTAHADPSLVLPIMGLVVGYPLLDTVLAFVRRFLKGKSPFAPDKDHIHHRMIKKLQCSTKMAVISLYSVHSTFCLAALVIAVNAEYFALLMMAILVLGVGFLLRKLGYLKLQYGFSLVRRRILEQLGDRVPRGSWRADVPGQAVLESIPKKNEMRPETEDEREYLVQTVE